MIFFLSPGENKEKVFPFMPSNFFFFIVKSDKWFCFCFSEKTREKWLAMFLRFSWEWKTFETVFGIPWKIAKVDRKIFYSYRKTIFQSNPEKFAGENSFAISFLIVKHFLRCFWPDSILTQKQKQFWLLFIVLAAKLVLCFSFSWLERATNLLKEIKCVFG